MLKEKISKLNLSELGFSGLDFKSVQEWVDFWGKKVEKIDQHRFIQFCDEKGYDVKHSISGTEFVTLLDEFEA